MKDLNNSIRLRYIFNMVPIILMSLYYYTHYIEGTYSFLIPLVLLMFWLAHSLTISNLSDILFNEGQKWWMLYAFVAFMMVILGFSSNNINFFIMRIPFYLVPAMGYFVIKHYRTSEMVVLLSAVLLIFFANIFQNISLWTMMPEIFEEQIGDLDSSMQLAILMNRTDTGFVAVCLWSIGMLIMTIDNVRYKKSRLILLIALFILLFFILFVNTRGTTTLLLGLMIIGIVLAKMEPKRANVKSYYVFSLFLIVFIGSFVMVPLLLLIIENTESGRLAERMNDVLSIASSKGNTEEISDSGSMAARIALSQTSLNTFFRNPLTMLFGIGDHTVSVGMDLHKSGIGNHSEFIDVLARYGLVGALIFVKILKSYYRSLKGLASNRRVLKYVNVIFCVFLVYGFLNNVFYPIIHIFMFIIFPIVIVLINQKYINYGR